MAALWMLADRGVSLLVGVVMTWHLTRHLGVTGYGYYTLAATVVTAFALVADLVGGQVVVREVAARPERADRIVGTALVLRGLLGCLALVLCALASAVYASKVATAILVLSATLLFAPCEALGALLQARMRLRVLSLIGMCATVLNLLLLLVAVAHGASLAVMAAVAAAPSIFRALATAVLFVREGQKVTLGADLFEARRLVLASWPLAVGALLSQIPVSLPTLSLAARLDGGVDLGTFAAASRIPSMLSVLPGTVMIALFPLMSRAWAMRAGSDASSRAESERVIAAVLDRAYAILLALVLPITISCVVLAPEAIRILYGSEFAGAATGLRVIALSLVLIYPGIAAGNMLVAMGRERLGLLITAGGAFLATVLTPLLAHTLGATGAAIAQAVVYAMMGLTSLLAVWSLRSGSGLWALGSGLWVVRLRRDSTRREATRPTQRPAPRAQSCLLAGGWYHRIAGCALVMTGVVVLLRRFDSFAAFAFGMAAYLFCLWLTGLMPIVLRLPTLETLDRAAHPSPSEQATLLYRIARRLDAKGGCWLLAVGCWFRNQHPTANNQQPPSSILVVDTDFIGDVILATPVLAALRRRFPEARLTLAASPTVAPLLVAHPALDHVAAIDTRPGIRRSLRLYRQLRALGPHDLVVGLSAIAANDWIGDLAAGLCGARLRLKAELGDENGAPAHWSEVYHAALRPLGIEGPPDPPRLATGEGARGTVERYLQEQCPGPRPWIGVHAGGRIYRIPEPSAPDGVALLSRRWPAERFAALVRRLLDDGATVFLTGSDDDAPVTAAILRDVRTVRCQGETTGSGPGAGGDPGVGRPTSPRPSDSASGRLIDTTGCLSLAESAALIERMDAFVSNDTGPMHLAFALSAPTVALFGPTDPRLVGPLTPGGNGPSAASHQVLTPGLSCSPCGGQALIPCRNPAGQECLTAVTVDAAYQAVTTALRAPGSGLRAGDAYCSLAQKMPPALSAEPGARSPERER